MAIYSFFLILFFLFLLYVRIGHILFPFEMLNISFVETLASTRMSSLLNLNKNLLHLLLWPSQRHDLLFRNDAVKDPAVGYVLQVEARCEGYSLP